MGKLRAIRATWTRNQIAKSVDKQQYPHVFASRDTEPAYWDFDRVGHATPGDRILVYSAALQRIHTRRTGLTETRRDISKELP